jgi:hypothetical protein
MDGFIIFNRWHGTRQDYHEESLLLAYQTHEKYLASSYLEGGWDGWRPFTDLCNVILLDCGGQAFVTLLATALKAAGKEIKDLTSISILAGESNSSRPLWTRSQTVYEATSLWWMPSKHALWNPSGFLRVTSRGVKFCAKAALVLLDGISIPVIAQELDNDTGGARLVGNAVVRGVICQVEMRMEFWSSPGMLSKIEWFSSFIELCGNNCLFSLWVRWRSILNCYTAQ